MRKLIVLALLAWAGYQAYGRMAIGKPSEAGLAYQNYASAVADNNWAKAKLFAAGAALAEAETLSQPVSPVAAGGNVAGMWKASMSPQALQGMKNSMIHDVAGSIIKITYDVQSEVKSPDGRKVNLTAVQTVYRSKNGNPLLRRGGVKDKHEAELVLDGTTWKVSSLRETAT